MNIVPSQTLDVAIFDEKDKESMQCSKLLSNKRGKKTREQHLQKYCSRKYGIDTIYPSNYK